MAHTAKGWFPILSGIAGMKLELYPLGSATIANGTGGDALTEGTPAVGFFTAPVTEELSGDHFAVIRSSGGVALASGSVRISGSTITLNPVGSSVNNLEAAALNQLAGLTITYQQPAYSEEAGAFSTPFVQGDSYLSTLAPTITFTGWTGRNMDLATIRLRGKNEVTGDTLIWTGSAASPEAGTWTVAFELQSADTSKTAGVYTFDVELVWTGPDEVVTPITGDRLVIVEDLENTT